MKSKQQKRDETVARAKRFYSDMKTCKDEGSPYGDFFERYPTEQDYIKWFLPNSEEETLQC